MSEQSTFQRILITDKNEISGSKICDVLKPVFTQHTGDDMSKTLNELRDLARKQGADAVVGLKSSSIQGQNGRPDTVTFYGAAVKLAPAA